MKVKRSKTLYRRHFRLKKILIIILALAVLLAVGLAISVIIGKLMYSEEPDVSAPSGASTVSVAAPSSDSVPSSSDLEPVSSAPDRQESTALKAVSPPKSVLTSLSELKNYCADAKASGADSIIVDVKDAEGHLLYREVGTGTSEAAVYAQLARRSDADLTYTVYDRLDELVEIIHAAGLRAVARINCFNDSYSGKSISGSRCVLADGTTWLDNSASAGGKSWLNPYSQSAQAFNLALSADCAAAGFDALIADYVQFPVGFSLSRIHYGDAASEVGPAQTLANFLSRMTEQSRLPVYLTVRSLEAEGSSEFAGSPFAYAPETLAGYVVILNAPKNPRKNAPAILTDQQISERSAQIPVTEGRTVIRAVIGSALPDALSQSDAYAILN